jgi:hypothetical protein
MITIQMKCLNFGDVTSVPPYRNLISRFTGEENPRLRIGSNYLNRREEDQDSRSEGILLVGRKAQLTRKSWGGLFVRTSLQARATTLRRRRTGFKGKEK